MEDAGPTIEGGRRLVLPFAPVSAVAEAAGGGKASISLDATRQCPLGFCPSTPTFCNQGAYIHRGVKDTTFLSTKIEVAMS